MDLLQTVRKEGSRGGRAEFKWEDVKGSQHRENYLGHSLMAPVGRWQKNKDLSWYAKKDADGKEISEAEARKEEIRRVKEAEADAMARALGLDVPSRSVENPNMTVLGGDKGIQKVIKESIEEVGEVEQDTGKGLGYGGYAGDQVADDGDEEVMMGTSIVLAVVDKSKTAKNFRENDKISNRRTGGEEYRNARRSRSRKRNSSRRERSRDRHDHHQAYRRHLRSKSRSRSPHRRRSSSRERRKDDTWHRRDNHSRDHDKFVERHHGGRDRESSPRARDPCNRRREYHTDNY